MAKMITERINKEELINDNIENIKENINKSFDELLNETSSFERKLIEKETSLLFKVFLFFSVIGIFYLLFKLWIIQKFQKKLSKKLNIFEIHKTFFKKTPINGEVTRSQNIDKLKQINDDSKERYWIPDYAKAYKISPGFSLNSQIGTFEYLSIIWKWEVHTDKGHKTFYKNVTTILFTPKIDKDFHIFNFMTTNNSFGKDNLLSLSLKKQMFSKVKKEKIKLKKIKLESPEFNKKIKVYTDNELKIRMIYTPFFMEKVIEQNELILKNIRKWHLEKTIDSYKMNYSPKLKNHIFIDSRTLSFNKSKIIKGMVNDVTEDFYDFYSTLQIMLFTNMFKF